MIHIPEDLEIELQKKFQDVHIKTVIQHVFQSIFDKTLKDGSCNIREFGKFVAFQTKSSKIGRNVVRFKFRLSSSLEKKIKTDDYLLNNIPVKSTAAFNEEHEEKCKNKRDISKANANASKEAGSVGKIRTNCHVVEHEVNKIINNINNL
jgi:hypothetical protein